MSEASRARPTALRRILHAVPFALGAITAGRLWSIHHGSNLVPVVEEMALTGFWWLFAVILACAFMASRHADHLAQRLGEPMGTIVLTLSAIVIEVAMVSAVMLGGEADPSVARNTMFATLMIILNGLVGLALLIGGWQRHEQSFNLQSSSTYLSLLIPLAAITLVLPTFSRNLMMDGTELEGSMTLQLEIFLGIACLLVYAAFLWLQTSRYRSFFSATPAGEETPHEVASLQVHEHVEESNREMELLARLEMRFDDEDDLVFEKSSRAGEAADCHLRAPTEETPPAWRSGSLLLAHLFLVVLLAEHVGEEMTGMLTAAELPLALTGVLVAVLILAPEGLAAVMSAKRDSMQRTMNILLGSALSTIGLTVPAVLLLSVWLDSPVALGLRPAEIVLLVTTLLLCMNNFLRGKVNTMQGIVHLTLFLTYCVLLFD